MITVSYYPSGESPLPDYQDEYVFKTFKEFKEWVQSYVCIYCLIDFFDQHDKNPENFSDWIEGGCGCEIGIEDPQNMIDWDAEMQLPDNFDRYLKEHLT